MSPDGKSIAIALQRNGRRTLWVRRLESLEMTELAGTDGARSPFWSPDGRHIGFASTSTDDTALKRISVDGGPTSVLLDRSSLSIGFASVTGTLNGDGAIVAVGKFGSLVHAPAGGAVPLPLATGPVAEPFFLPDGRRFLYTRLVGPPDAVGVYLASLDSKESRRLVPDASKAVFVESQVQNTRGYIFLVREGALLAQPVEAGGMQPIGEPLQIATGVPTRGFSVSARGTLVYTTQPAIAQELTWFDRDGTPRGTVGEPGAIGDLTLSPDGRYILLSRSDSYRQSDLWVRSIERGTDERFTRTTALNYAPVWSIDGRVVFSSTRLGRTDLFVKAASGATDEAPFYATKDTFKHASDWSRDGKFLVFSESGGGDRDIFALPAEGGVPVPVVRRGGSQSMGRVSHDGRWIAYQSDDSGQAQVYVQAFSTDGKPSPERQRVSTAGGSEPHWNQDGRELFYLAPDQKLMVVPVDTSAGTFEFGAPKALFTLPAITRSGVFGSAVSRYAVTADARRFLALTDRGSAPPQHLTVVTNWERAFDGRK